MITEWLPQFRPSRSHTTTSKAKKEEALSLCLSLPQCHPLPLFVMFLYIIHNTFPQVFPLQLSGVK